MQTTMRAARAHRYGPPEVLQIEEVPAPSPAEDEVLVEIHSAAVNFPDVLMLADRYQLTIPLPFTPGSEFAGTVRQVGAQVSEVAPGDRVMGSGITGAFAQFVSVPRKAVRPVPDAVSLDDAAAFGVTYRTAYSALRSFGEVASGDWVVVLGAAGGVGMAAVDLGHLLGARVLAVASSTEKLDACLQRGAEAVIDYHREDLKERIKEITGGGADVVIDPVGGAHSENALRATRWGGRFVTVGFASGEIPRIPLNLVLLKGVIVRGYEIRTFAHHAPGLAARDQAELDALFASGRLRPHISAIHPLADSAQALADLGDRRAIGKVLIHPWPSD